MRSDSPYVPLTTQLHAAQSAQSILSVLTDAGLLQDHEFSCPSKAAYDDVADAFYLLRRLTNDNSQEAGPLILDYLLPFILGNADNEGADFARYLGRDALTGWLADLSDADARITLRARILDQLRDRIEQDAADVTRNVALQNACWTVGSLGYRRPDIAQVLWDTAIQRDDDTGDSVLAVFTGLGVPTNAREGVLNAIHGRMRRRRSRGLIQALAELADPSSLPILQETWLPALSVSSVPPAQDNNELIQNSLILRILARVADKADALGPATRSPKIRADVPAAIWYVLQDLLKRAPQQVGFDLALGGDVAPLCDSAAVIPALLDHFVAKSTDTDPAAHHRYLTYLRAGDCIRPRQLGGWRQLRDVDQVIARLQRDACQDSKTQGAISTAEGHYKEEAWRTAFRLGYRDIFTWFESGIERETSPFLRGELCSLLAGLRVTPPVQVLTKIREPLDLQENHSGEVSAREGAIELASSSASAAAFEVLMHCGLSIRGQWLSNVAELFAACAVERARAGEGEQVVDMLLRRLLTAEGEPDQVAAAIALERVASLHLVPTPNDVISAVVPLLSDQIRTSFQRGQLLVVVGELLLEQQAPLGTLESRLVQWAQEDHERFGQVALETLALFDRLAAYPTLLEQRLGLQLSHRCWDVRVRESSHELLWFQDSSAWVAALVGLLYRHHPRTFLPAVTSLLSSPEHRHMAPLLRSLADMYPSHGTTHLPKALADVLVSSIQRLGQHRFPQRDLLQWAARLIPNHFAAITWSDHSAEWDPRLLEALADALRVALCNPTRVRHALVPSLISLMGDGQYSVRRAAYRTFQHHYPQLLAQLCAAWGLSGHLELRRRAAEASAWVGDASSLGYEVLGSLFDLLAADVEEPVRQDTDRSWREQRERNWAQQYLGDILEISSWSNDAILSHWATGEALVRIGTDAEFDRLRKFLAEQALPAHARSWLTRILKEGEKHWEEVRDKWPKPWERLHLAPRLLDIHFTDSEQHYPKSQLVTWQEDDHQGAQLRGMIWSLSKRQLHLAQGSSYQVTSQDGQQLTLSIDGTSLVAGAYTVQLMAS